MKMDKHHKFSKHRNRKKRYGDLIHASENIEHANHSKHMAGDVQRYNEREFCERLGLLHCMYCEHVLKNGECLWRKPGAATAENCRSFLFDKNKYKALNNTNQGGNHESRKKS
jgi:hypothetical protein